MKPEDVVKALSQEPIQKPSEWAVKAAEKIGEFAVSIGADCKDRCGYDQATAAHIIEAVSKEKSDT